LILEYSLDGDFVEEYDIDDFSPEPISAQGLVFAPTSDPDDEPNALSLYIADAMEDNLPDGRVYETRIVGLPSPNAPTTSGIAALVVDEDEPNAVIDLFAAFDDVEYPDAALAYTIERTPMAI